MGNVRVNKNKGYTVMSNYHLQDQTISLKAIGLLSKMLSLPENWDYSINGLAAICKEGVKSIRAALAELEDAGYLIRTRVQDEKGHFDYIYDIFETPQKNILYSKEEQEIEPYAQKGHAVEPHTQKGHAVNGHTQKGTQINTNKLITNEFIKKERKSSYNDILDNMVLDPKLKEALIEFIKMRKLSKKPPTDHALELLIKKLNKLSSDTETQIEIVEQSITNNWQSFFPLKPVEDGRKVNYKRETSRDEQYNQLANWISNPSRNL